MASKRKRARPATVQADPTPERLFKAGGNIQYGDDGQGHRITRITDAPLDQAHTRKAISDGQYAAGVKFRHHWYHSGKVGIQAFDPSKVSVGGQGWGLTGWSLRKCEHSENLREACKALRPVELKVIEMVICQEHPLDEVGQLMGDWSKGPRAYAAGVERLRLSLDVLRGVWGY